MFVECLNGIVGTRGIKTTGPWKDKGHNPLIDANQKSQNVNHTTPFGIGYMLRGEAFTTLSTSTLEDFTAIGSFDSPTETMLSFTDNLSWSL